jgi:hypothetical protein
MPIIGITLTSIKRKKQQLLFPLKPDLLSIRMWYGIIRQKIGVANGRLRLNMLKTGLLKRQDDVLGVINLWLN